MDAYQPDAFKTLNLRVDKYTRSAAAEGLSTLYAGDILTVVVRNVYGIDPTKIVFGIYSRAGDILSTTSGAWSFVPGCKDAVYASVSLSTANAAALAATLSPDSPVDVYLSMTETDGRTVLDTTLPFLRSLAYSGGGSAGETSTYVTRDELAALGNTLAAMPSMNDFDRKRKLDTLIAGLQALNVV